MDFLEFKDKYAETMMFYQIMENDIKLIYAFMKGGNPNENYEEIENKTLGQMINTLRDFDYSQKEPLISKDSYNFMSQICDNRNHWAHKVFISFLYVDDWPNSKEYEKQCKKLEKDHDRLERAYRLLEKFRLDYCRFE